MNPFDRRDLFRLGALGLSGSVAANLTGRLGAMINAGATPAAADDCAIVIFLRGAMDGVHTLVPVGDPTWPSQRAGIQPAGTVPLRNSTYAALNQHMSVLASGSGSPDARGHIAWITQCGNPLGTRSHFTEQQIFETLDVQPPDSLNDEGFVARLSEAAMFTPTLPAASVSPRMQRLCRSTHPNRILAHIKSFVAYHLGAQDALPGFFPVPANLPVRLRQAIASQLTQSPEKAIASYVDKTGEFMLGSEQIVSQLAGYTHDPTRFPTNSNEAGALGLPTQFFGGYTFMQQCEEALQLVLNSSCRVACVEIGGWDTHADQLATRAMLDPWLARAIRSLYDATVGLTKNVTIVVVTEFGRTNMVNNGGGTDHGHGLLMMIVSALVNGGVYHCHGGGGLGVPWNPLANPRTGLYQNALEIATDFRTVFAELLAKRFGVGPEQLNFIIPGWAALAGSGPQYTYLDFIN